MTNEELLSLDLEGARDYLLAWATTIKRYEQDLNATDADLGVWRPRIALAESKGEAALAAAARAKVDDLEARRASLAAEKAGLAEDLRRLKERLPYLKARERSIDPDRLLAELQLMTGNLLGPEEDGAPSEAAVEARFAQVEREAGVEDALAALKRKMKEGNA